MTALVEPVVSRRVVSESSLHAESLLRIPLVRQAFCDPAFHLVARSTDVAWSYERVLPKTLTGFNPFERAFYYGQTSRFAAWLEDPFGSARAYNDSDLLVREVLFMVHDYLHAWAYSVIDQLAPARAVFHGPITADTLDDYAFCHLLTEAVATVGLDYWFLCQHDLNELCPIGTTYRTLTVDYHTSRLAEYRRFCPGLDVLTPAFFRTLATFYCTGDFPGFDADDLRRSPQLLRWLRHELSYGTTQRELARGWLVHLADAPIALDDAALGAPLDVDDPARGKLIDDVGAHLWRLITNPRADGMSLRPPAHPVRRRAPIDRAPDFRFVNLARIPRAEWPALAPTTDDSFRFLIYQLVGQVPFGAIPDRKLRHLPLVLQQRSLPLALELFDGIVPQAVLPDEPRDLLIAN
jgi:hypothetical protein